ncbi:oligosaccharide flippase family protein [Guyparkeria sp. TX1]|uniref:oligosaccharide flippase family protein n=1 Tax=Guyparkeria sp. TX1 TaxID=3115001 RepID=UPI003977BD6A
MIRAKALIQRGMNSRFLRGVAVLTSANAAGQLILLAVVPLLTRLYTPSDFGVFAVFGAVMSVVLVASSLRYELAIPLPRHERDAETLLIIALMINVTTALIMVVVVFLLGERIATWTETPALASVLWLLPIVILVAGTYKALKFWAVRRRDFRRIAKTRISQSLANATAQVLGGLAGLGVWGLVIGHAIGQSAGVRSLSSNLGLVTWTKDAISRPLRSKALIRRHRRFPMYDVPAAVVNTASVQLPNFLLAVLFSPVVAGFYYLADRILATPMTMVSQAVAQVLYGDMRNLLAAGKARQRCFQLLLVMAIIGLPPTLVIFFYAEPIFAAVFGEDWRDAGVYASWLIAGLFVQFLYSPLSMVLMAIEGQIFNFLVHLLIGAMKVGALGAAYVIEDEMVAVMGIAGATMVGYGVAVGLVFFLLSRSGRVVSNAW